jgi:PAS domain S-box-containing protein
MADTQSAQFQTPVAQASDILHLSPPRLYRPAALPIPVLLAIIIALWIADLPVTYNYPNLNIFLNFAFTSVISLFIALLAARSYLTQGQPALLVLGAGVLIWSASGTIAVVFGQNDPNTIITIHNLCVLLSASCHFCSSLLAVRQAENEQKDIWLVIVYAASIALVAMITIAAQAGWTPQFFIQGQGGTPFRQLVLVASIAMFVSSAAIIEWPGITPKSAFSHWYAMALLLIATGIFGIMVQPAYSSLVGWAGRIAQYLGSFYMLTAAFAALRESGSWQVSIEKQLILARQDYFNLLDLAADGILVYEPKDDECEGRLLQVNPALCQLLGYEANELLSMTTANIIAPVDRSSVFTHPHLPESGGKMRHESCLKSKDGHLIPVEISTHIFKNENGYRGLSIIRDITVRKRAEEALRESEQRFRLALRGGDVIIAMCDRQLRYSWIYDPHPDFDAASIIGKRDAEIADNDGAHQLEALKKKVFDTGAGARSEIAFPLTTGNQIFDIQAVPHFNGSGNVEAVSTIAVDVTARKKVEARLRESEQRFRTMAEGLPLIVWVHDAEGRQQYVNQTFLDFFGVRLDEMIEGRWQLLLHPDDSEAYANAFTASVRDRRPFHAEARVKRADGQWRWIESWGRPRLSSLSEYLGYVGTSVDITERKQAEKALVLINETLEAKVQERSAIAETRASQLRSLAVELIETEERERRQFAHLLHEDLQQLLAAAKMQVYAVAATSSQEPVLSDIATILEEAIAKSRQLSHELSPPVLHQAGLISALKWLSQHMHEKFGLDIELEVNTELLLERTPQKVFLFRAVQELLFNTVKHAGVKNAKVAVSSTEDSVIVTVSDQGCGFNPEVLSQRGAKVGFGLLTIKERASYIGGTFTMECTPRKGSRFTLKVPNSAASGLEEAATDGSGSVVDELKQPRVKAMKSTATGISVLFVDDHQVMRQGLIKLVKGQAGIDVVGEAANGQEAIEQARRLKPDLIVMDISMPAMDGIEASRRIKAELPRVRIIGLTMHDDPQLTASMRQAGAEIILNKTLSAAELVKAFYGIQ